MEGENDNLHIVELDPQKEYTKLDPRIHVLKRPDSYVGSLNPEELDINVVEIRKDNTFVVREKKVTFSPAIERIYLEILSNAADNKMKSTELGFDPGALKVEVTDDTVSIYNEGRPVSCQWHNEHKAWIPSMIFFDLLSGSSFNDDQERKSAGRNGYGAKLTAIFSTYYKIECHNTIEGIHHEQFATDNLANISEPVRYEIEKDKSGRGSYTRVTFKPDFKIFYTSVEVDKRHRIFGEMLTEDPLHCRMCWTKNNGYENPQYNKFSNEFVELMAMFAFDFCFNCFIDIDFSYKSVFYNKELHTTFDARSPLDYVKTFIDIEKLKSPPIIYETSDTSIRCIMLDTPYNGFHRSFANGMPTRQGGVHVNAAYNGLTEKLKDLLKSKNVILTSTQVKNHITCFLSYYCVNPQYTTQTKEKLTKPTPKFEFPHDDLMLFSKWGAYEAIKKSIENRLKNRIGKALDGKKTKNIHVENSEDADMAGTSESWKCTGIVYEGLSAISFFNRGLKYIRDPNLDEDEVADSKNQSYARKYFGAIALRGKPKNVMNATDEEIIDNKMVQNLAKFFGLREDADYSKPEVRKTLRYGRAMIMTDADVDGTHIKMIDITFFARYKGLLESGFLCARLTPVVIFSKGKKKEIFYSLPEVEAWKKKTPDHEKWAYKYYKGLGSATDDMIKNSFQNPVDQNFVCTPDSRKIIEVAMSESNANIRKKIYRSLIAVKPEDRMDLTKIKTYEDVVYQELILFGIQANRRAIPSKFDGLKDSTRKVVFSALKRPQKLEGVEEFQGLVKNFTKYKHGPESMKGTIIGVGQDFPGSNNIPLLFIEGESGSRKANGKDAAAARYLECMPSPILRYIFRKEDDVLLAPEKEEGKVVGVETYFPIIPLMLVNRSKGVGWGWSTDAPNFHPFAITKWIRYYIQNIKDGAVGTFRAPNLIPWWRGYKGNVIKKAEGKWLCHGFFDSYGDTTYVRDLPIHTSGIDYVKFLEKLVANKTIREYTHSNVDLNRPSFILRGCAKEFKKYSELNLEENINITNMVYLDETNLPHHFSHGVVHVMLEFCELRYKKYIERRELYLKEKREEHRIQALKAQFIEDVIAKPPRFDIRSEDDEYIINYMDSHGYPMTFTSVPYNTFSKKKVEQIRRNLAEIAAEIEYYENVHPGDLWIKDLEELESKLEELFPGEWNVYPNYGTHGMKCPH